MRQTIWVGYDPREGDAFAVASRSAKAFGWRSFDVRLPRLRVNGNYRRPTERRDGRLWDVISDAPMATEFAISRFLVPHLAGVHGWALFIDCDMMWRRDPRELFALADPQYAVMCVKHDHRPAEAVKMDGQVQTAYPRKNWSSVMLFNLGHPKIRFDLTLDMVNTLPGRDLHRFCWLEDSEIGALPREWNHLVGVDPPTPDAALAHFTLGVPSMAGYESCEFAEEWRAWIMDAGRLPAAVAE